MRRPVSVASLAKLQSWSLSPSLVGKITESGGDHILAGSYVSDVDKINPFGFSPSFQKTSSPRPVLD
eukprot:CAMPEP_0171077912 /NCGR_PEP_ID=MMETSP0766_2-20121228/14331_1 /TAXON_ID=439317 /ORGANISM="Gambierdiscus australes, Strain CAWD 149" /LENGTH=66 /DNA_ID=CAMNT_0011535005 /DNA_START=184 /DNA_END=384 /DNA_ORIENTATION=+